MLLNIYHIKNHSKEKSQILMILTFYVFVCRPISLALEAVYEITDKSQSLLGLYLKFWSHT
jgi:hypothetical protein